MGEMQARAGTWRMHISTPSSTRNRSVSAGITEYDNAEADMRMLHGLIASKRPIPGICMTHHLQVLSMWSVPNNTSDNTSDNG